MSMNELRKKGDKAKVGAVASVVGSVVLFVLSHWILGIAALVLAGYFGWQVMKNYAETGRRF